mmetsp:Transcript_34355/g.31064  ORF Transcript_34355/g.31064 Transcript_34355/m.31064 type:complete len:233 (-) Transcript_34355:90-788(-)
MAETLAFSTIPDQSKIDQLHILRDFKTSIQTINGFKDHLNKDDLLLRFLHARKFNLDDTMKMFNDYVVWRNEHKIDDPFDYPEVEQVKKYFPHGYFRTDKQGRPIYIERPGVLDFKKLLEVTTIERFLKYYIHCNEKLIHEIFPACVEESGHHAGQTVYIIDLAGMGIGTCAPGVLDIIKEMAVIGKNYYPEKNAETYIVNTPWIFYGLWAIISLWLNERTLSKIHIKGSNF